MKAKWHSKKRWKKAGKLSEDDSRREQQEVQDITNEHIKKIDEMIQAKEKRNNENIGESFLKWQQKH